jgi:hypothetical protein
MARSFKPVISVLAQRSVELSLAEGEFLTGRYYFALDQPTGNPRMSVEVWERSVLTLQSKQIPLQEGTTETALAFKGLISNGVMEGVLEEVYSSDTTTGGLIVSVYQPLVSAVAFTLYVEVSS